MFPHTLIKLLRTGRKHYDHTYTEGLNICPQPWTNEECAPGGLYACPLLHIFKWITLYPDITEIAWVDIPADAQVAWFKDNVKTSKLVLTGFMPMDDAIRLAIQAGADIHTENEYALRRACDNGYTNTVRLLLAAGANVHAANDEPLRYASHRSPDIVRLLLNAGADVHALNDDALFRASTNGRTSIVLLLLEAGATVHDEVLREAKYLGHTETVCLLLNAI